MLNLIENSELNSIFDTLNYNLIGGSKINMDLNFRLLIYKTEGV